MRILISLCLLSATAFGADPYSTKAVAYMGVNVLPMTDERVLQNQTVLVRDGRIQKIGSVDSVKVPRRATRVEAEGAYLMPGLIDLHVHFNGGRTDKPRLLNFFTANGVTAVLNMRGNKGVMMLAEQVESGDLIGPEIFSTSPIQGNFSPTPTSYEAGVQVVEKFHREGFDFIKVYNFIPEEAYRGIMDAAHRLDMPVVGHTVRSVGLAAAMENGQHLAHLEEVIYGHFADGLDEEKIPALTRQMKESGISIIATLVAYKHIIRQLEDIEAMLASPGVEQLPESLTKTWQPDVNEYLESFNKGHIDSFLQPTYDFMQKLINAFHDAGVPILLGTDATLAIVVPGYSAHTELQLLVDAGMSPYDALVAGTREAAEFLGQADEFGTIEVGKRADFILLDENPLEDIAHSRTIRGISVRGLWQSRAELDAGLGESQARK